MKTKRKGFLSAKVRKPSKDILNQKEQTDNNKKNKKSKIYNLSLNINNSNKDRIYGSVSPKHKYSNTSKFIHSFSNNNITSFKRKKNLGNFSSKNIFSTTNGSSSIFPTVVTHKSLVKSPSAINYFNHSRFFKIEDEKLSQEIYYLKNDINKMNKKLFKLGIENKQKQLLLTKKENEINTIINKNHNITLEELLSYNNNNYNNLNDEYNIDNNNFNLKLIFNDISLNNYNYNNLFIRIRHQILKTFKEIKEKEEEIESYKKSNYYTKMNEINLESSLYKQQIDKINILINNALLSYERNQIQLKEYELLKNKIKEQEKVLKSLNNEYDNLQNEEFIINENIKKMKNVLDRKNVRKSKNTNLINTLNKKNNILLNDKTILMDYNNKKISEKISQLKKNLDLFKFHYRHTSNDINHLKEKRENLMKKHKIKNIPSSLKSNNYLTYKNDKYSFKINQKILNKKIEELSQEYANKIKIEKYLENKMKIYESKLNKIINNNNDYDNFDNNNDANNFINNDNNIKNNNGNNINENNKNMNIQNEEDSDNTINFRINEDNPFYSEEETNIPEKTNKFNNYQFCNFAYILFKNFESKNILLKESQTKIINPFINIISQKDIKEIKYNNNSFNIIIEELTNIMMNVLENTNKKNKTLISLFLGALLHNSNYDLNKFINYINVLFSYTNNYSNEEEIYTNKLQTKYKDQLILLYNKLYEYIKNNSISQESNNYIPLLKMKKIIEINNIQLKDKYLEFLYYYMKKFYDIHSNLEDLNFDLLNNFFLLDSKDNNKYTTSSNKNESVTEITNEEYEKELREAIEIIKKGLNNLNISFNDFVKNITNEVEIDGIFYNYFNIDNFNIELKRNNINLSELKLSCLCNKYHITENLQIINKEKIENDIDEIIGE